MERKKARETRRRIDQLFPITARLNRKAFRRAEPAECRGPAKEHAGNETACGNAGRNGGGGIQAASEEEGPCTSVADASVPGPFACQRGPTTRRSGAPAKRKNGGMEEKRAKKVGQFPRSCRPQSERRDHHDGSLAHLSRPHVIDCAHHQNLLTLSLMGINALGMEGQENRTGWDMESESYQLTGACRARSEKRPFRPDQ